MPEIPVGSTVGFSDHTTNIYKIGLVAKHSARSYTILTENGNHISRNRIDLKCTSVQFEPNVLPHTKTHDKPLSTNANKSPTTPSTNIKHVPNASAISKGMTSSTQKTNTESNMHVYKMCSGCI